MKLADCVIFSGLGAEIDLLEIRMTELNPIVDQFVIVENDHTFTGTYRGFQYWKHVERLKPWSHKISYLGLSGWPKDLANPWARETWLRNQMEEALQDWSDSDRVIASDCDEIPAVTAVEDALFKSGTTAFSMPLYYYWLNCLTTHHQTYSVMGTVGLLRMVGGQSLRCRKAPNYTAVRGGWHFSCLGGVGAIIEKIKSFSHTELDREPYTNSTYLRECITAPKDFLDRPNYKMEFVEIDNTWPEVITQNREKYAHLEYRP